MTRHPLALILAIKLTKRNYSVWLLSSSPGFDGLTGSLLHNPLFRGHNQLQAGHPLCLVLLRPPQRLLRGRPHHVLHQ